MTENVLTHGRGFDVEISKLSLRKISDPSKEIILVGGDDGIGTLLVDMHITEHIFAPSLVGNMVIKEPADLMDDFKLTAQDEIVHIEMKTPHIPDSEHILEFCVSDANRLGDSSTSSSKFGGDIKEARWKIHFQSCESYYLDVQDHDNLAAFMNQDRFMKIATKENENDIGIINELSNKYFNPTKGGKDKWIIPNPMEIEETSTGIWIKENPNLYPWGKNTNSMSLMQLLFNLTDVAIANDNKHCNFLFWHDFDGWHFKSINKIINDSDMPKSSGISPEQTKPYVYSKSDGVTPLDLQTDKGDPKILFMRDKSSYDHFGLWQDGAYSSYYELIKPNHSDPYHHYLDASNEYSINIIDYDYHRDFKEWNTIEEYKIIPDSVDTSIDKESPNKSKEYRNSSEIYGYFSPFLNDNHPKKYDFLSSRITGGKYGRLNNIMWQTMDDQTNLDIEILKKIKNKIIKPVSENYEEYLRLKNLKEKWNVYRHTICCDKQDIKTQFLAVIDDAKLIQDNDRGGIYEYSWREVEMWPTAAINGFTGENGEPEVLTREEAPISVVVIPNGLQGIVGDEGENSAFNINELMNIQDEDDIFVGPGVNVADGDFNDYPEAYQMMPVGGYFKVGEDPCVVDHEDNEVYFHKHIVQMNMIPSYMLNTIVPSENEEGEENEEEFPEKIYFFDVPNAHDGLCDCIE